MARVYALLAALEGALRELQSLGVNLATRHQVARPFSSSIRVPANIVSSAVASQSITQTVASGCSTEKPRRQTSQLSAINTRRWYASEGFVETREAWNPIAQPGSGSTTQSVSGRTEPASVSGMHSTESHEQAHSSGADDPVIGPMLDDVVRLLQRMGKHPGRNCVIAEGLAMADIGLFIDGITVAISMERDQPAASTASQPMHATQQTEDKAVWKCVLEAHGWHAVTLSADIWSLLSDDQAKQRYLASVVNDTLSGGVGRAESGCCGGGCGGSKTAQQ